MSEPSPTTWFPPPRLLVSVRDADEGETARAAGADLVDAKDPAQGALGALPVERVRAIVARLGGAVATSAVAGEPDDDAALVASVAAMAAAGVHYVKVAIRPGHDPSALSRAAAAAPGRLIGVLFAEDGIEAEAVPALAASGFRGAMIDTRGKDGRGLPAMLLPENIAGFVAACRTHRLLSGLAGSLRVEDVALLSAYEPGYLGFRGGLCRDGDRRNLLDPSRVNAAAQALRAFGRREAA